MNLILYSGGDDEDNVGLDKKLVSLGNGVKQMTFIPADSYDGEFEYFHFIKRFKRHGVQKFFYFPVDLPYSQIVCEEAFKADAIFLGGGNTYYFLKYLKMNKLLSKLKKYVKEGGVLCGESAGAIIMTSNINTASFPKFDRDENEVNLNNFSALNLVDFEFFPHYKNSKRYESELSRYSKKSEKLLVASIDGGGVVCAKKELSFVDKTYLFQKGKIIKRLN